MGSITALLRFGWALVLFLAWQAFPFCLHAEPTWESLTTRLIKDGHDSALVGRLFSQSEVQFWPEIMLRKLAHKESKLDYSQFLEVDRLRRAREYLEEKRIILDRLEESYGVPNEIKVAILLIETNLGRNLGRSNVFNTLANMAVFDDFEQFRRYLPHELTSPQRIDEMQRRLLKYSHWAYGELKSLIRYAEMNGFEPTEIHGSIFGAFGLCQFIPSNAVFFGVDENGDGRVDLFQEEDALASMANYLRYYGWREGLSRKERESVIYQYNHSEPYVRTVLAVADHLKGE